MGGDDFRPYKDMSTQELMSELADLSEWLEAGKDRMNPAHVEATREVIGIMERILIEKMSGGPL